MKFRSVEEFAENEWNLFFDDAGSVVLDGNFVFIFSDGFDLHPDFGEDTCFFAGIEGVIDGFFDGGEQGFSRVIEAEHVPVFGEEFADGDFFL